MGRQLDLLVAPFGRPVVTGDDPGPMHAAEVAVDEGVPRLRLVGRALGEAQMPGRVLLPAVALQEGEVARRPTRSAGRTGVPR